MWQICVLKNTVGKCYTGGTENLDERLGQHMPGIFLLAGSTIAAFTNNNSATIKLEIIGVGVSVKELRR